MKDSFKIAKNRILSLRRDILIPGIVAFLSILLVELKLKYIPAFSEIQYDFGQIYTKLCYSFTSAFIFYFLVVHLPRERRKAKSFRYINNKTLRIDRELSNLLTEIGSASGFPLSKENYDLKSIEAACAKINPNSEVVEWGVVFPTWFDYFDFKGKKIKMLIYDLLILNEIIDSEFLEYLTFLHDELSEHLNFENKRYINPDLSTWSKSLFQIIKDCDNAVEIMRRKYRRYTLEHHKAYLKRNKRVN